MTSRPLKKSKHFSYGFDPLIQEKYVEFVQNFLKNPAEACKKLRNDPVSYIQFLCKTVSRDPQTKMQKEMMMELMPHQKKFIEDLYFEVFLKQKSCVILKSRQQGASWLVAQLATFISIFHQGQTIIFTTMDKDDLWRSGNPMTLMGKCEYVLKNLPVWFTTAIGLNLNKNSFTSSKLQILIGKSLITGSTGDDPARGQTAAMIVNDEFDMHDNQENVIAAVGKASPCNIYMSTLKKKGSTFSGMTRNKAFVQLRLYWKDDERVKDKDTYKKSEIERMGLDTFNREMEMKHSDSDDDYLILGEWIEKMKNIDPKSYPKGAFDGFALVAGLDLAGEGKDRNVLKIRKGPLEIYKLSLPGGIMSHELWDIIIKIQKEYPFKLLVFDSIGVGFSFVSEAKRRQKLYEKIYEKPPFSVVGLNFNTDKLDRDDERQDDSLDEKSDLVYQNIRSRLYWKYRENYRKTVEGVAGIFELIFLHDQDTIDELELITYTPGTVLKIISKIDLRKKMKKMGRSSPDNIDADIYCLYAQEIYLELLQYEEYEKYYQNHW